MPDEPGTALRELDRVIAPVFAGLERVLWEGVFWGGTEQRIIGYGAIREARPRGASVDWFLVGLAAQAKHLSVYVSAVEDGEYLVRRWAPQLGRVKVGASALTFRSPEALELEAFERMLRAARAAVPDAR